MRVQPLLAIVPARGGSQGVPRKNMRELAGRPLIAHTVSALAELSDVRVVVTSDDDQVLGWARINGVEAMRRPDDLATPDATIADVAAHMVESLGWSGTVGVFQPTSPLRSAASIRRAREVFEGSEFDSLASVVREPHLMWFDADGRGIEHAVPLFHERVNRQYARHRVYRETGAIQLVAAAALLETRSMVTPRHRLFELDEFESDDVDTPEDLERVRRRALRGSVIFRLTANSLVGSGHLHHCLQLAEYLDSHRLEFLLKDCDDFARDLLRLRGWPFRDESELAADLAELRGEGGNVVVNDVLDSTSEDILTERSLGYRVVCVEDLGDGAQHADWVVNALYPAPRVPNERLATGSRYATLRSEFLGLPSRPVRETPQRVLVTFGGTDPGHLADRVVRAITGRTDAQILVVLGAAAPEIDPPAGVEVRRNVSNMAEEMWRSDLVVTAAGRTVFEAAAVGTPVVAIAQNAREATHSHLRLEDGVVSLGLGVLASDEQIREVIVRLLADVELRRELSDRLRRSIDHLGAQRIAARIEAIMKGQQ